MIDKIIDALLADPRNGLLGILLVASWIVLGGVIGLIWNVWRAEEKQWNAERAAIYQDAQAQERERFKDMLTTMQNVNAVLSEIKGALKRD